MAMHQATVYESRVHVRETSCYSECCSNEEEDLVPTCEGWMRSAVGEEETVEYQESEYESENGDSDEDVPLSVLVPIKTMQKIKQEEHQEKDQGMDEIQEAETEIHQEEQEETPRARMTYL